MQAKRFTRQQLTSRIISGLLGLLFISSVLISNAKATTPIFTGCIDYLRGSHCDSIFFQVVAADTSTTGNRNNIRYHLVSGPGEIDERTGLWQFHPELEPISASERDPLIEIAASIGNDTTHGEDNCRFYARVKNVPPNLIGPVRRQTIDLEVGDIYTTEFQASDLDSCDQPVLFIEDVYPEPDGELAFDSEGKLTFVPVVTDQNKLFTVILAVTDGIDTKIEWLKFRVGEPELMKVTISQSFGMPGGQAWVDVKADFQSQPLESFEFVFGFDRGHLRFNSANIEDSPLYKLCDWEYFRYNYISSTGCESDCPSGTVQIRGIADLHHRPFNANCLSYDGEQHLFRMIFDVAGLRCLNCAFIPIRFWWLRNDHNSVRDPLTRQLFVSASVRDWDYEQTGIEDIGPGAELPTYLGLPDSDLSRSLRMIQFTNGGIHMACMDTVDPTGDLNQDGLSFTDEDMRIYAEWFTNTNYPFEICNEMNEPDQVHCSTAVNMASDINGDNRPFTMEDFLAGIAWTSGRSETIPCGPKYDRKYDSCQVYFDLEGKRAHFESNGNIGALQLRLTGLVEPTMTALDGISLDYTHEDSETELFIYSLSGETLPREFDITWTGTAVRIIGLGGTYEGTRTRLLLQIPTAVESESDDGLPVSFALHQNYPNPFNPNTQISFDLPEGCDVSLQIYNILGRLVRTVQAGSIVAGSHTLSWDGKNNAGRPVTSGIYLYRLEAGNFVATRKMLLLK